MPTACGAPVKYMWVHHDGAYLHVAPPIENQWYTVLEDDDVRLLWIVIKHFNDEADQRLMQVKVTLDGTPFIVSINAVNNTLYWIYRDFYDFAVWGGGLTATTTEFNAAKYTDARAHHCKIEVRLWTVPGTNEVIDAWVAYETLERVPP